MAREFRGEVWTFPCHAHAYSRILRRYEFSEEEQQYFASDNTLKPSFYERLAEMYSLPAGSPALAKREGGTAIIPESLVETYWSSADENHSTDDENVSDNEDEDAQHDVAGATADDPLSGASTTNAQTLVTDDQGDDVVTGPDTDGARADSLSASDHGRRQQG
jgi:hypothetical protein